MPSVTDTLNEFNSANKYGDAFGLDAGKIADGIKGFGSKPSEKETTKEPEGKAGKKESKQGESGDSAKDFIDAAKKVAEIQGSDAETVATEEKPLSRGEELRQKYGHLSPEERKALLAQKLEENAERQLQKKEAESEATHFYKRHGAQTTLEQQRLRATQRERPDGGRDRRTRDASRFVSHQAQLNALLKANLLYNQKYKALGQDIFVFDMNQIIGEGYERNNGEVLIKTSKVEARYSDEKLYTLFPKIRQ